MSTISAGTTSTTALVSTGDTTGNLVLATGATPTTALTLDSTTQAATFAGDVTAPSVTTTGTINAANTFGFKNRLINGGMVIDQRNAGASVTITSTGAVTYVVDRWFGYGAQASKFTVQQNAAAVTPPVGFINYLGATSSSAYSVISTDQFNLGQSIEGLNVADLGWGTANAKAVTLSFWVRSSLTGTFGGSVRNAAYNYSYLFSYSIPVANTWTQISVTIAGPTSGTWLTTNASGMHLGFSLGAGSTYSSTAGSWSANNYSGVTGQTSVVGTSGATFYITGVQLEVGSQATSFDFRDYGRELILCQRYYELKDYSINTFRPAIVYANGATPGAYQEFAITKRTAPSISWSSNGTGRWIAAGGGSAGSQTATASTISVYGASFNLGSPQNAAAGWVDQLGNMQISAEL